MIYAAFLTYPGHILPTVSNRLLSYPRLKSLRLLMCTLSYRYPKSKFHLFLWHILHFQDIGTKRVTIIRIPWKGSKWHTLIWLQFTGWPWVKDFVVVVVCVVGDGPFPEGTSAQLIYGDWGSVFGLFVRVQWPKCRWLMLVSMPLCRIRVAIS